LESQIHRLASAAIGILADGRVGNKKDMPPTILTKKQKQFYDALKNHIGKNGESPTVAELMKSLKISSPRAVTQYLETLERKGFIARLSREKRGIRLVDQDPYESETVTIPVMASAGCDNVNVFAELNFDEYICIGRDMLEGKRRDNVVCIRAAGSSMDDAGITDGDYVLVEMTEELHENDLVVAIIDSFAVIKKIEFANNAIILRPVSTDPQYKPIILNRNFRLFGKVVDIIRHPQKGEVEIVPLVSEY
jgi:SOS regulatory protein LexA